MGSFALFQLQPARKKLLYSLLDFKFLNVERDFIHGTAKFQKIVNLRIDDAENMERTRRGLNIL